MLELKIQCEDADQARVYLNAEQYHNLITDFYGAIRSAQKHGTDADILHQVKHFFNEFATAAQHHQGPY